MNKNKKNKQTTTTTPTWTTTRKTNKQQQLHQSTSTSPPPKSYLMCPRDELQIVSLVKLVDDIPAEQITRPSRTKPPPINFFRIWPQQVAHRSVVWHLLLSIQHPDLPTKKIMNIEYWILDIEYWILNIEYWIRCNCSTTILVKWNENHEKTHMILRQIKEKHMVVSHSDLSIFFAV